ncbi:MAG: heavy-metal-associated domain-containing protein [Solobacterium sp.]|nr:heavy-metal-associated domain-containing protein [Solobacterium sp.]
MRKITVGIDGMMCGMCESHINDAIRQKFPQIKKVSADRKKKQALILSENDLDEQAVKETIDATGYTFLSLSSEEYKKKGLFGF